MDFFSAATFFFDGIRIGGEVVALGLRVPGVAECAFDTKVPLILMHEFDDVVASNVFRKRLDVGGIGTRSPRLAGPRGLRGWRGWSRSFLRQQERSR